MTIRVRAGFERGWALLGLSVRNGLSSRRRGIEKMCTKPFNLIARSKAQGQYCCGSEGYRDHRDWFRWRAAIPDIDYRMISHPKHA